MGALAPASAAPAVRAACPPRRCPAAARRGGKAAPACTSVIMQRVPRTPAHLGPGCGRRVACNRTAALTESSDLSLGTPAPAFQLPEPLTGKTVSLDDFQGSVAVLVMFLSVHCPFVKLLKEGLGQLARDYQGRGVQLVAISSNSVQVKAADSPEGMAADCKQYGWTFPYLHDESQEVAKAYQAMCTPEFFLLDGGMRLFYHGQFDDARPSNGKPVTGSDVRAAIDQLLAGGQPVADARPSIGCNIKWRPGNEPAYYTG